MNYVERTWRGNRLPLKKAVCGIDLPYWALSENDNEKYLSGDAVNKLAEYEELEEQGRLIKLPCKVGDKVYLVDGRKILEETVLAFSTFNTKSGETVTTMTATYDCYFTKPNINDLGVLHGGNRLSFFFSRKEAEVAIKKMKGE